MHKEWVAEAVVAVMRGSQSVSGRLVDKPEARVGSMAAAATDVTGRQARPALAMAGDRSSVVAVEDRGSSVDGVDGGSRERWGRSFTKTALTALCV